MRILLRRPSYTGNTGDELMLCAAKSALRDHEVCIATGNMRTQGSSYFDAVLDCCGYAYTDYWGPANAERLAEDAQWCAQHSVPLILLPQTYGPFTKPPVRDAMQKALAATTLLYARDEQSLASLQSLMPGHATTLRLAPDISFGLRPTHAYSGYLPLHAVAVLPNMRMLDTTPLTVAKAYIPFMQAILKAVRSCGGWPFLLAHDRADDELVQLLTESIPAHIPLFTERDPLRAKALLGRCRAVVSSRYHGLLNGLSQGIPVLGTAWSHKFDKLFREFSCEEYCIQLPVEGDSLLHLMRNVLKNPTRKMLQQQIAAIAKQKEQQVQHLWDEVLHACASGEAPRGISKVR